MDLQDLLKHKDFDQLNTAEKAQVLKQMSQAAYQQQREIVKASQLAFAEEEAQLEVPPPSLAIQQQLQANSRKAASKPGLLALLNYRIKAWQAVAASLLLVLAALWLGPRIKEPAQQATVQIVRDTIEIVKQIPVIKEVMLPADTIYKVIYQTKYLQSPDPAKSPAEGTIFAKEESIVQDSFAHVLDYYRPGTGKPVSQDSFLRLVSLEVGM